jgi:hypothetical protein
LKEEEENYDDEALFAAILCHPLFPQILSNPVNMPRAFFDVPFSIKFSFKAYRIWNFF